MQEALSGLAVDYGIVSKKATKVQIKESVLNVAVQLLEHVTYIHTYIHIHIYIYICSLYMHVQDWANTECGLHRALASYVHRRVSQNSGSRLGSSVMIAIYI